MTDLLQFSMFSESEALALDRAAETPPYPDDPSAIIVSVSGGVDSDACAVWARKRWPKHKIILWHAYLADMDWWQTGEHLDRLAAKLGNCERVSIQAVYELTGEDTKTGYKSTRLRRLHDVEKHGPAADSDPNAILTLCQLWEHARLGMPPTIGTRYCTDYFKQTPFEVWTRQNRVALGHSAVLLSGERWAESDNRANVISWEWRSEVELKQTRNNPLGWRLLWARPLIDRRLPFVTKLVVDEGLELHPGYAMQGQTTESMLNWVGSEHGRARLSCVACIFTQPRHLKAALVADTEKITPYVERVLSIEARVGRTWQQSGALLREQTGKVAAR